MSGGIHVVLASILGKMRVRMFHGVSGLLVCWKGFGPWGRRSGRLRYEIVANRFFLSEERGVFFFFFSKDERVGDLFGYKCAAGK